MSRRKDISVQAKAFELYYSLGQNRSIGDVANILGKNMRTVKGWCSKFDWDSMVIQRDLEVAGKSGLEELRKETLAIRTEYRKAMDALLTQAEKDIEDGKLQIKSIEDLEVIIKLDLLLMGEPVECVEMRVL